MFDRVRANRLKEGGFTLIELLIVIVILGILAAVVVFSVQGIQNRGQDAACQADYTTVSTAQEAFYADGGAYAGSVGALQTAGLIRTAPTTVTTSASGAVAYAGDCAGAPLPGA